MRASLCGVDCSQCEFQKACGGCVETGGHPFGGPCIVAACCNRTGCGSCAACGEVCRLKTQLLEEFYELGIAGLEAVTELYALKGAYINLEYRLPSGQLVKVWDDNRIYLGNQVPRKNSKGCYGLTADEEHLLVCTYGPEGTNAEILVYQKRKT